MREPAIAGGWVRGLLVWAGAAVLGAFGCSFAWVATADHGLTRNEVWAATVIGVTALIFTLPESGLLMLTFAGMRRWSIPAVAKYLSQIAIGGLLGFALVLVFAHAVLMALVFGAGTAMIWSALHAAVYRGH
jgi:hypothetical protein